MKVASARLAPVSHHPDFANAPGILNLKYVSLGNGSDQVGNLAKKRVECESGEERRRKTNFGPMGVGSIFRE